MLTHAKERKASGEKYCDCAACAAVEAILKKKEELLCYEVTFVKEGRGISLPLPY